MMDEPQKRPRELLDAVGELALAITPHHFDTNQRAKIASAIHVLVDHIIAEASRPATPETPEAT